MSRLQPLGSQVLPKAPKTSQRGDSDQSGHVCSQCRTPFGVSTILCRNDTARITAATHQQIEMAEMVKEFNQCDARRTR